MESPGLIPDFHSKSEEVWNEDEVEYVEMRGASSFSGCLLDKSDRSSENSASTEGEKIIHQEALCIHALIILTKF